MENPIEKLTKQELTDFLIAIEKNFNKTVIGQVVTQDYSGWFDLWQSFLMYCKEDLLILKEEHSLDDCETYEDVAFYLLRNLHPNQ